MVSNPEILKLTDAAEKLSSTLTQTVSAAREMNESVDQINITANNQKSGTGCKMGIIYAWHSFLSISILRYHKVSEGNFADKRLIGIHRKDEFGELAIGTEKLRTKIEN